MTELKELTDTSLVSEEFLRKEEELTREELEPYLESTGIEVDLDPIREKIQNDVYESEKHGKGDSTIDGEVAETVRRTIDLTRREAAIDGIWHYLTVVEFPEFVRYRWESDDMRGKFLDGGEDIYSNALHRLWWIAEITREEDDYTRTSEIFEMQELANDVADRWYARYKPITWACVDELKRSIVNEYEPQSSKIVSKATTQLNEKLTVSLAEGLTYDESVNLVREVRSDAVTELS
jgi:hypothetical protein